MFIIDFHVQLNSLKKGQPDATKLPSYGSIQRGVESIVGLLLLL